MQALKQRALPLCAVLTTLALLVSVAPDVAALWGAGHDHGHGGWGHRSADHARHDDAQVEPTDPVQHAECAVCTGRSQSVVPLLLAPTPAAHQDAGQAILHQASYPRSARALRPSQPRAPPAV